MGDKKIVMLGIDDPFSRMVYHSINDNFKISNVILERPVAKKTLVRNRIRKLGIIKVLGQVLFQILIQPILKLLSYDRINSIVQTNALSVMPINSEKIFHVDSVNASSVKSLLVSLAPDLIIINGTRILSNNLVKEFEGRIFNIHTGITPLYRGVHGGYWALANNDIDNFGVTLHFVDSGVDTGKVIAQKRIIPTQSDNFVTYPYLQMVAGINLLKKSIPDFFNGTLKEMKKINTESKLWYHPTILEYLLNRIFKKVK